MSVPPTGIYFRKEFRKLRWQFRQHRVWAYARPSFERLDRMLAHKRNGQQLARGWPCASVTIKQRPDEVGQSRRIVCRKNHLQSVLTNLVQQAHEGLPNERVPEKTHLAKSGCAYDRQKPT